MTAYDLLLPTIGRALVVLAVSSPSAGLAQLQITDRAPTAEEVGYLPGDGHQVAVNPPPLAWLKEAKATSYALEISRTPEFEAPEVRVSDTRYLLYTHTSPLPPAEWYWRYRFSTADGQLSGWSRVRRFSVPADAPEFPRPSAEELARLVPKEHPRMFVRPETLDEVKSSRTQHPEEWGRLVATADKALRSPLMQEPRPWSGGTWNADEWRNYLRQIGPAVRDMETLAFAALLTREAPYESGAKERLLHFASWKPLGTSSMKVNDEVGMPLLHGMSRTYSWIRHLLTSEEVRKVHQVMSARGTEAYQRMRRTPYEQFAYDSHFGRMWHFLGEAGLAFYGEIPEAAEWLEYAFTIFYGWYPIWGDPDGGWAEGIWYWSSYNDRATWWLELISATLAIDGTRKPFYANVGDFPLYVVPPGNPVAGFGDFSEIPPPPVPGRVLSFYAKARSNGVWQWYTEKVGVGDFDGPIRYLRAQRPPPEAVPPRDMPLLKIFSRAGYALFHTNLAETSSSMHLAMRCSPYGNISHSHCDQNAVVFAAYGEPLLVNTGVRDFYGSPFCKQYYWHTQAHNALLLADSGQARGSSSRGEFVASGNHETWAYVVGDATSAYPRQANLYRRWAVMVRDEAVILLDEVATTSPRVRLLYHGRSPFDMDAQRASFELKKGNVRLLGQVFAPSGVQMSQTDEYPLQPAPGTKTRPEWHLTVSVPAPAEETARIVTVLVAEQEGKGGMVSNVRCDRTKEQTKVVWQVDGQPRKLVLDHLRLNAELRR